MDLQIDPITMDGRQFDHPAVREVSRMSTLGERASAAATTAPVKLNTGSCTKVKAINSESQRLD